MKHAIAIWNYCWQAEGLPDWIRTFADAGFEVVSLHPKPFEGDAIRHLGPAVRALEACGLEATLHGSVLTDRALFRAIVEGTGDRLLAVTMDGTRREDSRGFQHDAATTRSALEHLLEVTAGTRIRVAVEDFPLDERALECFASELGAIYRHPRVGILVDVGHMHIRMNTSSYFRELSVLEYFERLPCPLVEVHVHDNDGKQDMHGHFGMGTAPIEEIAAALTAIGFDGVATLEIAPSLHDFTPEASLPKALTSFERWRELLPCHTDLGK